MLDFELHMAGYWHTIEFKCHPANKQDKQSTQWHSNNRLSKSNDTAELPHAAAAAALVTHNVSTI